MRFFVYHNDETLGPLTEEEIRNSVRSGRFFSTTQIWQEGGGEWKELHSCFANLEYSIPSSPSAPEEVFNRPEEPDGEVSNPSESLDAVEGGQSRVILSRFYRNSILPSMRIAAPVSAIGGFVADVLQPLGPFSFYLTVTAVAVAMVFGILWWVRRRNGQVQGDLGIEARIAGASLVSAVVLATGWVLFTAPNPDHGFLGSNVSIVDSIQRSMLGVQESVERVESVVTKVSTDVEGVRTEVKVISDGISSLGKMGGLIKNPETAIECYNNALIYKERGDVFSTREALQKFLNTGGQKLEPFEMLVEVLKGMEGSEGGRASYEALVARYPDNLMLLHHLHHFLPKDEKIDLLVSLTRSNPEYTPAFYDLLIRVPMIIDVDKELTDMFEVVRKKLIEIPSSVDREEREKESADSFDQVLAEEYEKLGGDPADLKIEPGAVGWDEIRSGVDEAQALARLRNNVLDEERWLKFLVEVRKEGLQRVLSETNESIHEVLNRHDFSKIYEAFLELEKRKPIKSYYYDQRNSLNEGYPQEMFRNIPRMIEKLIGDLNKDLAQVDVSIEESRLRVEELKHRYEAGVPRKSIKINL